VSGVGNAQTRAEGKGTINIRTMVNHQAYNLTLRDVLYILSNPHNLISLGRWDNAGGNYHGGQGILTMNARNGKTVAVGTKINNNLYKLKDFTVQHLGTTIPKPLTTSSYSFNVVNPFKSWNTWHRRFSHLGMTALREGSLPKWYPERAGVHETT